MPPKRRRTGGQRTSPPGDRLGALPDDVLHLVLSHLPAEDAVRTCVLARRWLNLWKSATGLHIDRNVDGAESMKALRDFIEHLLLLRAGSPLDTVELRLEDVNAYNVDDMARIRLWIRHIMACRVRVLTLEIHVSAHWAFDDTAQLRGLTLISNHLRELYLFNIDCEDEFLDFSCCPALEVLEAGFCDFSRAGKISSPSLRCLRIRGTCTFHSDVRIQIYAPNLRSLQLQLEYNRAPVLMRMPFLMEASVELYCDSTDFCDNSALSGDCEDEYCEGCYGADGDTENCVLLQGLSEARNLALISYINIFTFRRDLKWRPVFGNLKTLLLNEYWCEPADFSALAYMLEHSPVLEKLTLELDCKWRKSEAQILKGIPDPTERSDAMPEHLKMVELKCKVVDDKVLDVLKFFGKRGICKLSRRRSQTIFILF